MINFLVEKYTFFSKGNERINILKNYFQSFLRLSIRIFSNIFLPVYFKISSSSKYAINKNINGKNHQKVIVSLTTFPKRINRIWIVVECILRQTVKPDKIILWLSKKQFPNIESLPKNLLRLRSRGLEIILCDEDLRSHKKYYYAFEQYPDDLIITVDDDFIYPVTLIEKLLEAHHLYPNAICALRAMEYSVSGGQLNSYLTWKYLEKGKEPSHQLFFTSGGGTLFTSRMFHKEVLNKEVFLQKCLLADDIWLNIMAQMNATKIMKSSFHFEGIPILNLKDITLSSQNVGLGLNDKQWQEVVTHYAEAPLTNILMEKND